MNIYIYIYIIRLENVTVVTLMFLKAKENAPKTNLVDEVTVVFTFEYQEKLFTHNTFTKV